MNRLFSSRNIALGVLILLVIGAAILQRTGVLKTDTDSPNIIQLGDQEIRRVATNAFGLLSEENVAALPDVYGQSKEVSTSRDTVTDPGTADVPPDYIGVSYAYSYTGELPNRSTTVDVLKRLTGKTLVTSSGALADLQFGLVDIASFNGSYLNTFSLTQEDGYTIDVNLSQGVVSIYDSSNDYGFAIPECVGEVCALSNEGDEKNIGISLSDAESIAIANTFLQSHGISLDPYGTPISQNAGIEFSGIYRSTPSQTVTLTYPLLINNKKVFSPSGDITGMIVTIDAAQKRVSSVYNILSQRYEASSYPSATEDAQLKTIITQGGIYGYRDPNAVEQKNVSLGAPEDIYVSMAIPDAQGINYEEVYVPGWAFAVDASPYPDAYLPSYIVTPLAAELISTTVDGIKPMPSGTGAGMSGVSSGSAGAAVVEDLPLAE